ncbi:MAG: hypothetical protein OHK0046_40310 [Anaerolineae bacterium]
MTNRPESDAPETPPSPAQGVGLKSEKEPTAIERLIKSFLNLLEAAVRFVIDSLSTLIATFRALVFLIIKTPYILLPSAAHTSLQDDDYNKKLAQRLKEQIDKLPLTDEQKATIKDNWIEQIGWTNNRATRERDANELIRWWMIILGVLIPVLNNVSKNNFISQVLGLSPGDLVSLAGIFVAILTAIYQFRRPEERWRHYRVINERYLNEIWDFITLSSPAYENFLNDPALSVRERHRSAYKTFHQRMSKIKQDDTNQFFGEVVQNNNNQQGQSTQVRFNVEGDVEGDANVVGSQPASSGPVLRRGDLPARPQDEEGDDNPPSDKQPPSGSGTFQG